jgi:hypothetical protein
MHEYPLTPTLSVSFQRYPCPPAGWVTALAPSYGALPLLRAPGQLLLPCPDGEAFWIGLVTTPPERQHRVRVLVTTADGKRIDALTGTLADLVEPSKVEDLQGAPRHGVPGIFRGDGSWWALAYRTVATSAPACRTIELQCRSAGPAAPDRQTIGPGRQHTSPGFGSRPPESRPSETLRPPDEDGETFSVRIDVVEPEQFKTLGGIQVPPLNEGDRYGGWRLP